MQTKGRNLFYQSASYGSCSHTLACIEYETGSALFNATSDEVDRSLCSRMSGMGSV
jgi:hypothetical protein